MKEPIYPWHLKNWQYLQNNKSTLPHAMIFHGPEGTGIEHFAELWAQNILCENHTDIAQTACECSSCRWFSQHSHPDFRQLTPESFEAVSERADNANDTDTKKTRVSQKIPIDAIRQLHDFVNITSHRGGEKVILIFPVESMTIEAANALLKMLEEPPEKTFFLLVTAHMKALLPTILSRCGKLAFPLPNTTESLQWLEKQHVKNAAILLAEQGGAPLFALEAFETASNHQEHQILLDFLLLPQRNTLLKTAEQLQKVPIRQVVLWLQRWGYDLVSQSQAAQVRYHIQHQKALQTLALKVHANLLFQFMTVLTSRKKTAEHPLAPRLLLESLLIEYLKLFSN